MRQRRRVPTWLASLISLSMAKPGGTKPNAKSPETATGRVTPKATARYTPPIPKSHKTSPMWVPILMFVCLGLGMLTILANYVDLLPGDGPSNTFLLVGLGLITVGLITATKLR